MIGFEPVNYVDEYGYEAFKFEARKKFPSGMTGVLIFDFVDQLTDGTECYNVDLDIRRKRKKRSEDREVTGRDGLETASWVLEVLAAFETQAVIHPNRAVRVEVQAADERRWNLYERILTRRGYSVTMVDNSKTLVKRIEG